MRMRGSGKSICFLSSTGQGRPRRRAHFLGQAKGKSTLTFGVSTGIDPAETFGGKLRGEPGVDLGQQQHMDVVADVDGAGTDRRGTSQPVLHEVGREPRLLVGAEGVGDDEFAEAQAGTGAVIAEHLDRERFGQSVRREVGQALGAGTLAALEDAAGQEEPAAAGGTRASSTADRFWVLL